MKNSTGKCSSAVIHGSEQSLDITPSFEETAHDEDRETHITLPAYHR